LVLVHHALQSHAPDLAAREALRLARRRVIAEHDPIARAGLRLARLELRVLDPLRPTRDARIAARDQIAIEIEHRVATQVRHARRAGEAREIRDIDLAGERRLAIT